MKATVKLLSIVGMTLLCLQACKSNMESASESVDSNMEESAYSSNQNSMKVGAESKGLNAKFSAEKRKFMRTANLKFKVEDIIKATQLIEDVVAINGGFITHNQTISAIESQDLIKQDKDSSIQVTSYLTTNNMQLSVPEQNLDLTLKTIAPIIQFLDNKTVDAEDVQLKLLENELAQKRSIIGQQRIKIAIDDHGKKLNTIMDAEDKLIEVGASGDEYAIANLALQDKVAYSTVTLEMYQNKMVRTNMIANLPIIPPYETPFYLKIWDGFVWGFDGILNLIVALSYLWVFVLIGVLGYQLYIRRGLFKQSSI